MNQSVTYTIVPEAIINDTYFLELKYLDSNMKECILPIYYHSGEAPTCADIVSAFKEYINQNYLPIKAFGTTVLNITPLWGNDMRITKHSKNFISIVVPIPANPFRWPSPKPHHKIIRNAISELRYYRMKLKRLLTQAK